MKEAKSLRVSLTPYGSFFQANSKNPIWVSGEKAIISFITLRKLKLYV